MEVCATSDGSGVVYALRKPIKPQEKTRVGRAETPAGGRARAWLQRTRNENRALRKNKIDIRNRFLGSVGWLRVRLGVRKR